MIAIIGHLISEIEAAIRFWTDEDTKPVFEGIEIDENGENLIKLSWDTEEGQISGVSWHYDPNFGRGEWMAETMEDAKQMAIDFNEGVS